MAHARSLQRPQLPNQARHDPPRVANAKTAMKKFSGNVPINLEKLSRLANPKILIKRRLGGVGDVLMTTPLLRAIKKHLPHCVLTYATDMAYSQGALADIVKRNPFVDEVVPHGEVVDATYDYVADITSTGLTEEKSGTIPPNRIDMFAAACGLSIVDDPVPIYITTPVEQAAAQEELRKYSLPFKREEVSVFIVQAKSNDARRSWPLTNVQELCNLLSQDEKHRVLLFDWGHTVKLWKGNERLFVIADRQLQSVASLIETADMVICPDSSFLHLAGALSKKTVSIFGPIPPQSRINHYPNTISIMAQGICPQKCLTKDSYVLTSKGYREIKSIEIGDLVYTAVGTFEEVIATHRNKLANRKIYELNFMGTNEAVLLTEDHKILVAKREYSWKSKDWKDHGTGKRRGIAKIVTPEWKEIKDVTSRDYCCLPIPKVDKKENFPLLQNKDLAWLLGLFIAEGWTYIHEKTKKYNIFFSINREETWIVSKIKDIVKNNPQIFYSKCFNKGFVQTGPNSRGNSTIITIYNKAFFEELHRTFKVQEGETINNASKKHIPYEILSCEDEIVKSFISGLYQGDGYEGDKEFVFSTSSRELAYGIQLLYCKLGYLAKIYKRKRDTNFKKDAIIYRIYKAKTKKTDKNRFSRWYSDENYIYTPIKKVKPSNRNDKYVFDISVENDPTFTSQNVAIFDCWYVARCNRHDGNKLECLTKITPEQVYEATMKHLQEPYRVGQEILYGKNLTVYGQDKIILVKRSSRGLGDILMASTGIEALKKKYPTYQIHVAVPDVLFPALENTNYIDQLIDIKTPINLKRYHIIMDISTPCARYETARIVSKKLVEKNRVEVYAEALGVRNLITDLKPRYFPTETERQEAEDFIAGLKLSKKKPFIGICFRAAEDYRSWSPEKVKELVTLLNKNYHVIAFGDDRRDHYEDTIDVCGMPIRQSFALLGKCDCLITVDTGLLHAAQAIDIPTVALFGPIDYKARCRGYSNVTIVKSDLSCIPCWRNGITICDQTKKVQGYSKCLEKISAESIFQVIESKFHPRKE